MQINYRESKFHINHNLTLDIKKNSNEKFYRRQFYVKYFLILIFFFTRFTLTTMCRKHQGRKCLYFCVYTYVRCIISVGQLNPSYKQKRIIFIFIPNPSYFLLTGKYFRKSFQLAFHNHKWSRVRRWHVFVNFFTWWLFLKGFCCFKIVYLSTNKSFADALHCKYVMSKKYFNIYI